MGGSFISLVKREFFISGKKFIIGTVSLIGNILFFVLILLSAYYGNIRLFFDSLAVTIKLEWDTFLFYIVLAVKYVPLLHIGFLAVTASESAINDDKKLWTYFRRSTPVPAWKFSLTNVVMYAVIAVLGFAVGTAYLAIISAITGTALLAQDIAVLLVFIAVGLILAFIFQTMIKLFHSVDRAGIALVITVFAVLIPIMVIQSLVNPKSAQQSAENGFDFQGVLDFITDTLLPFLPLIIAAILGLLFISNYFLMKRREK
ncbi:MAG: hypothetical protein ACI4KM_02765 [Oscillospiraceae bacterium]